MIESQSTEEGYYLPSRRYMDCASPEYDPHEAAVQAEKGASEGNPDAQYLHGLFLYTGEGGTHEDAATASEMFALSASTGYRPAGTVRREIEANEPGVQRDLMALRLRGEERDTDACAKLFDLYDNGKAPVRKDHSEAIRFYTVCAECDDVAAQNTVGFMFLMGKGIRKDRDRAVKWLKAAADNGCGQAMYRMGKMYDEGLCDTDPDLKSAMAWYQKAADADDPDAEFALGCIYSMPRNKYSDDREAARMFGRAAENGHAEAQYQIGMMYAYGQGVPRDPSMAKKYLEKSCEGDYQQAMVDYANMCFEGQVLPKDYETAAKWFTVAAERCNGYAQYALGCMYASGYHFPQNSTEAIRWFREAAEMGEVNSQYALACFYYEGRGVERDEKEAVMWFDQAADQGHPAAKAFLGMLQITGTGTAQDVEEGLRNLNESADTGYYEAQYYLGKLYYEGKYVNKNVPRAKKFLNLAAKQGDRDAIALLNKIKTERSR